MISLGFLGKVPNEYFCTYEDAPDNEVSCKPDDFCKDPNVISYRPNMELKESYTNWISHYGLTCTSGGYIGLIASAFFIGWIGTLVFIPRLSDLFGRQRFIQVGNIFCSIGYSLLFMTHSYFVLVTAMATMGACCTLRTQISVIYFHESLSKEHFTTFFAILASFEGLIGILASIYFIFISKNWIWLIGSGLLLQLIGTIGSLFFLESPRWLIKSGNIKRAQQVFEKIADWNGVDKSAVSLDII